MISIKLKDSLGNTIKKDLPNDWSEVTVDTWLKLSEADSSDPVEVLSKLIDIPVDDLNKIPDIEINEEIYKILSWFYDRFDFSKLKRPTHIIIEDEVVKTPEDLGKLTFGQRIHAETALTMPGKEALINTLSIYLEPIFSGKTYSKERADQFHDKILKMKIIQAYPLYTFFLSKSKRQTRKERRSWLKRARGKKMN